MKLCRRLFGLSETISGQPEADKETVVAAAAGNRFLSRSICCSLTAAHPACA
ncbi:hypothetical protein [Desulfobulbus alkaliphilus]|uniref:hypothetical protein n=1 Tax=Desulfobulbus alkaliphilus TaxID=869814 RepID=UPI001963DF7B|nr:hypothetical protein [Desulfobulbus alkaliphilus]MBM9538324.1 hypothetical protein [Desulfobulbus alkaliphilus]